MAKPQSTDVWAIGDAYEPYVERWSREEAQRFLTWLDVQVGARWLDVGRGTGALSGTILEVAAPSEDRRAALRERVGGDRPITADGSISLSARAWAVRGQRA